MKILVVHAEGREVLTNVECFERRGEREGAITVTFQDGRTRSFFSASVITGSIIDGLEAESEGGE